MNHAASDGDEHGSTASNAVFNAASTASTADTAGNERRYRLVVLTGPTAVGKGTLEAQLIKQHPNIWLSISATTREPRPQEVDGVNYHFMSVKDFTRMQERGEFLETAQVHHMAYYGTPLQPVLEHLRAGVPTVLEIDLQGARRVRERARELGLALLTIFIAPPSFEDLRTRLQARGTETPEQQERRLKTAHIELAAEGEFDKVVVNDDVERAADELWELIAREYA